MLSYGLNDEDNKSIYQQLGSLTGSVSASNEADDSIDSSSITVKPMTRLIYGVNNYGVSVSLTKGNDQQFSNDVPTPVNGEIVEVGNNSIDGNFVVIRTNSKSNYNEKGDLVKISNLASTDVEVGDVVEPGEQIGLQGDDTDLNSGERSTTGSIVSPGHLTVQIFQGDTGEVGTDTQYSQGYNTAFVNGMFIPLYTDVLAAANEVPATPINTEKGLGYSPDDIDVGGPSLLPETVEKQSKWRKPDGTWNLTKGPKTLNKLRQIAELEAISTMRSQLSLDPNAGRYKTLLGLNNFIFFSRLSRSQRSQYFTLRNQYLGELRALEASRHKK